MEITVMSDLHLSKKPWQVRKALRMGGGSDAVLLVGDLTNDGTAEQMTLMQQCIAEVLPETPVFAVAGNHDYPVAPSPMLREGICDITALQDWLLNRQDFPYIMDDSGVWVVRMGQIEIIGLNCVWHWRRFKFKDGAQLNWLEHHIDSSEATWHIILCHAPLLAHNPKRSDTNPYLSRNDWLQRIVDAHRNIIFISGHTHVSMESPIGCTEFDRSRRNYYINDGSIRPTTMLNGLPTANSVDGNVVKLLFEDGNLDITALSTKTGQPLSGSIWGDGNWEAPVSYEEVTSMLTQCYPNVIQAFLKGEGYDGAFYTFDVGCVLLNQAKRFGVLGVFQLYDLERRYFSIFRFLNMLETARNRYVADHPDQRQLACELFDAAAQYLRDRQAQWEQETNHL